MNIRIVALGLILAAQTGLAQEPYKTAKARAAERAAMLETLQVLFRSARQKPAFVEQVAGAAVYPTVVNTRTGMFGVLTGTLVVKPKKLADAAAIASSHGLEKGKEYPHLQAVFYRAKAGTDIADAAAALQADARIESAYPEIIEYVRVPK